MNRKHIEEIERRAAAQGIELSDIDRASLEQYQMEINVLMERIHLQMATVSIPQILAKPPTLWQRFKRVFRGL